LKDNLFDTKLFISKNLAYLFVSLSTFLLYTLLNFQMLTLQGWKTYEAGGLGGAVKAYHVFFLLFTVVLVSIFIPKVYSKAPWTVLAYLLTVVTSGIYYLFHPFNSLYLTYLFVVVVFYIAFNLGRNFPPSLLLKSINQAILIINLAVFIKLIFYADVIFSFLKAPNGHPILFTFYGGGVNLEASWVAINSSLLANKKKYFYPSVIFSILLSIAYSSRAGMILTALSFVIYFLSGKISKSEKRAIMFLLIILLLFGISYLVKNFDSVYVLDRFTQMGTEEDKGSLGRLMLWENTIKATLDNALFGFGPGNSIYAIERYTSTDFTEDNLHNYYIQSLVELGLLGCISFILIVLKVTYKQFKTSFTNLFGNFMLLYFAACLIQFRGADAMFWLIAGFYFSSYKTNNATSV
jgi:O-antigen ligase